MPFIILVFFIILFIVSSSFKISILVFNMPNTSLFLGLYVEINGVMFSSTSFCVFNKIFLGIHKALKIPALITSIGYCQLLRIEASYCRRIFTTSVSETIVQILRASENGMFIFVALG